jgi:hypothetical protein
MQYEGLNIVCLVLSQQLLPLLVLTTQWTF